MRFVFGLIVGVAVTLGAAYIHDANVGASSPGATPGATTGSRQIVNWDVLNAITREQMAFLQAQWNKIFR